METAVLALVGLTLTVMIHLDRSRGKAMQNGFAELASALNQLRTEMTENNDKLRTEMTDNNHRLRAEMTENNDKLRAETQAGFAANATALLELARNVGRVEGRTETLVTSQ